MVPECVVSTVKHGGGGVIVRGCFAGDTIGDKTDGTLNQHGYYSMLQRHAIPSGQECWETISGDYLMKLTGRMPRVHKVDIKGKGGYFEELKI